MKRINYIFCLCLTLLALVSCTSDETDEVIKNAAGRYVYEMTLDGGLNNYGVQTRAAKTWKSGDVLYIRFGSIQGTATYNGSKWSLSTDQSLSGSGTCSAVEIDNAGSESGSTVNMTALSAVYRDTNGSWSLSGSTLNVSVYLQPVLGRIRLRGSSGTSVSLSGMTTYIAFNKNTGNFTTSTNAVSASIQSTGYTPYIYGSLSGSTLSTNGYTMQCPSSMLLAGTSGWVNYPTSSSHTGWSDGNGGVSNTGSHEYVDLGLSVKWATCNVGASKPEDYGNYYAWGETSAYGEAPSAYPSSFTGTKNSGYTSLSKKTVYSWSTYKYCRGSDDTQTKYCTDPSYGTVDNKTVLDLEDDAAHVNWGGSWRMPTKEEQDELRTKCTWTWTSQNGVNGYKVTSKTNGNSLFLPVAGVRWEYTFNNVGLNGDYWSSSLFSSDPRYACYLNFKSSNVGSNVANRIDGRSVRAVSP